MHKIYRFIDMMPYSPRANISSFAFNLRVLKVALFVLNKLKESLVEFYINQNIMLFDPHVGENLCQIRACYLLELQQTSGSDQALQAAYAMINKIQKSVIIVEKQMTAVNKKLALPNHLKKRKFDGWSELFDFLESLTINFQLSGEYVFLYLSHVLSCYKTINDKENIIIDYKLLRVGLDASKNLAHQTIHCYQKILSELSTRYICTIPNQSEDQQLLKLLTLQDDDARTVLPCFAVMQCLLKKLKSLSIPILLLVRSNQDISKAIPFLYKPHRDNYEHVNTHDMSLDQICIVFYITMESPLETWQDYDYLLSYIDEFSIENILLAQMAAHPQYSGRKLHFLQKSPYGFLTANIKNGYSKQAGLMLSQFSLYSALANDLEQSPGLSLKIRHITAGYTGLRAFYCQATQAKLALTA